MKKHLCYVLLLLMIALAKNGEAQNLSALAVTYPLASNCISNTASDNIIVRIRNLDAAAVNSYTVSYQVNGNTPVSEVVNQSLAGGATVDYTFTTPFTRESGVNDIKVYTSLPGDIARANDTARVRQVAKINSFPYYQNFETNDGGFSASGTNSSWGWGSPNKAKMKPGEGSRSWYNGYPNSNYFSNDASFLTFPCFDFTNLTNPQISFKFFLEVENGWESVVLEYSTNGTNYMLVGTAGEANSCNTQNWYNAGATWSGNTEVRGGSWGAGCANNICGKWVVTKHCLDFLKGQPNVYFRLRFASTGTQQEAEGVGIDSLVIGNPAPPVFSFNASSTCAEAPMMFTPSLHPCITSVKWDFGDNTPVLTLNNAVHRYKNPGNYEVKLIATSYCGKQDTVKKTVTVYPPPAISQDANVLGGRYCATAASVTLAGSRTPSGGTFTINGTPATVFDPVALGVGFHTVVYSYTEPTGNRCTGRDTQRIEVYLPSVSIDSLGGSYCLSSPTVQLKGTPSGGTFTVDGNPATSFSAAALGLGPHLVEYTYTDPDGCIGTDSKTIDVVSNIVAAITNMSTSYCSYEQAFTLTGTPVGGIFKVDGVTRGSVNPQQLTPGPHRVIYAYSDGGSCGDQDTFDFDIIKVTASIDNVDSVYCYNASTVVMQGSPAGGDFLIDNAAATNLNPGGLSVGMHKVMYVYMDPVSFCIDTVTKNVRIDKPVLQFTGIDASYCKNTPNVTLAATPSGGTFKLGTNTVTQINPTILDTGLYTLTYTYTNPATNCSNTISMSVYIAPLPDAKFVDLDSVFCITSDLVALKAQPSGGAFTINSLPVQMLDPSVLDVNVPHLVEYQYVEQNYGCLTTIGKQIKVVTPPSVSMSGVKQSYCLNDSTFTPTGNPSGGKFILNNTDTVTSVNPALLGAGTHKLTYYYNAANGCDASINQQIVVKPAITGNIEPDPVSICEGEATTLTFNGNGNMEWNTKETSKSITIAPLTTRYYWVKATDCANFYDSVQVTVIPLPTGDFSLSEQEGLIPFKTTATAINPTSSFMWWVNEKDSFSNINPLEYTFSTPGQYSIQLVVDSLGCRDTITKMVTAIEKVLPIRLPNVFTPDKDGMNDDFGINHDAQRFVSDCVLQVFNRWGNLLFETSDPYQRWNGTDKGSDAPDGVYFYILKAKLTDNTDYNLTGSVQVIRGK